MSKYYDEMQKEDYVVSPNLVNEISGYLVAKTETREELNDLLLEKVREQYARKEALKRAYEEVPIPRGSISLEARREIQERRNDLAEIYYIEYLKNY